MSQALPTGLPRPQLGMRLAVQDPFWLLSAAIEMGRHKYGDEQSPKRAVQQKRRLVATFVVGVCACALAAALAGCGSSGGSASASAGNSSGDVVLARVGSYAVTKAQLAQWMTEKLGEDFYLTASYTAPAGLVSEPADYSTCVATAKKLKPSPGYKPPQRGAAVLMRKCRELYEGVREQALEYLVSSYWALDFYSRKYGVGVSDAEAHDWLEKTRARRYPKQGEFEQLLASRHRTIPQELLIIKNDILAVKVKEKLFIHGSRPTSSLQKAVERAESTASCSPGYLVKYCAGYSPAESAATASRRSVAVLLEELLI